MTNITVKSPAAYENGLCQQLQDKAEEVYRLHGNKLRITNHAVALFDEFQTKIKEGWSYEITKSSATINEYGAISITLIKPAEMQEEEIKAVRLQAKADYISRLEQEKTKQTALLAEQQLATHLRKEEEKKQKELAKLKAQFEADAVACFANIRTSDE